MKSTPLQCTGKTTKHTAIARGITTVIDGDRANATRCLLQEASGPDCRDHKSAQMTESRNSEEEDSKSNQSHATQVSKEQPHTGVTRKGHAGVSETDQMIAMNTGGMSHSKQKTPTGAPKAPGKKEETNQVRCKAI